MSTTTDTRPVASYARRSKRKSGDGKGATINIADQHAQNAAYLAHPFPGAPVVEYDDNMSAWNPDAVREDWDRLLADVRAGKYRAVVGRYADRLTRQPEQGELLLSACKASGTELHTTSGGHITSALAFRIELAIAAEESDQKSRRMTDKHRTIANGGGFHGGRRRYGYVPGMMPAPTEDDPDNDGTVPEEAEVIREIAQRLLNGETLAAVARDLTARKIPTTRGGKWSSPNLRNLILRPHLAGLRVHHGTTYPADWTPILSQATHEALVYKLGDPKRRTSHTNARRYLLAGLAVCDECGAPLRGRPTSYRNKNRTLKPEDRPRAYVCATGKHVHRPVPLVDATVADAVVVELASLSNLGVFTDDAAAARIKETEEALAGVEARRATTRQRWSDGKYDDDADYHDDMAALKATAAQLTTELTEARESLRPHKVLDGVTGSQVAAERFNDLPLGRQRAIIAHLTEPDGVRLRKSPHRRAPFDPERDVDVVFRDWTEQV